MALTRSMDASPDMDPITEELFRNAIAALGDEMVLTIYRTAYSGVLKNIMDYSAAICDAEGRLVAQGLSLPGHLCSIPVALQAALRHFGDDIAEGDILINNDPYDGGMHLPDIFIFKPLFADGRVLAYAATICHHTDVGGRVPGSNASDSTEIYAEGLRIPPLKLYERGVRERDAVPHDRPQRPRAGPRAGRHPQPACGLRDRRARHGGLVARYGAEQVRALMVATMDYSERLTRHCLARTAGRRGDVHGLDRRRPDRCRQADPAGLHGAQARRHDGGGLDRQRAAGEGRDQQHLELHRGGELHRGEVGAVGQHAEQRRRVPPDQGDRAGRARSRTASCRRRARRAG